MTQFPDAAGPVAGPVGAPLPGLAVAGGSGAMFDRIAARYDLLNRVMTGGIDRRWRRLAIARLHLQPGMHMVDLATGTGDLAILAAQACDVRVTGLDPSLQMLARGRTKVERSGLQDRVTLQAGDAQSLPFAAGTVDAIAMGFGIRNVPDRDAALREMARVLRPGGRVAILEASEPRGHVLAWAARLHLRVVVPVLGAWLSGAPAEYRYLQRSIADFPPPDLFAAQMARAGLRMVAVEPMLLGVAHLYVAEASA